MMKAIIEYELPHDEEQFELAQKSGDMYAALWDMGEFLRQRYKHTEPPSDAVDKELEAIKDEFYRILNDRNLEI